MEVLSNDLKEHSKILKKTLEDLKEKSLKRGVLERKETIYAVKHRIRDQFAKQIVLKRADGICEACGKEAPFKKDSGEKYLETHHIIPLSENGADRFENMCAVCPNCHRELHSGERKEEIRKKVQKKLNPEIN